MHNKPEKSRGFTLIELMITISIAAILMAIAIPSFNSTIRSTRLTTYANELITSLNLARSEAIKRGIQMTARRKGANSQQWESGWDIFVDLNGSGTFSDDGDGNLCETNTDGSPSEDCLLRTYDPLSSGYTLRTGANYACWVAYIPSGMNRGSGSACNGGFANDTFRLCDSSADTTNSRSIIISAVGRPRVSKGTTTCP
jgi:type IV fimbrial biogenesis protein FimT